MAKYYENYLFVWIGVQFIAVIIMFVVLSALRPDAETEVVVVLRGASPNPDFTNADEGSLVIVFSATEEDVNFGPAPPSKIQIFRSKNFPAISFYYLYAER